MKRLPTLDGWRGVAISLVLFEHITSAVNGYYLRPWFQTGQHGVTIFFVLSGFLITTNLLVAPIDLRRFYIRRFFRLMPAAWAYLFFIVLLGHNLTSPKEIFAAVFFYRNFIGTGGAGAMAGHFWSLSLEEQFYLFWPCLLLIAGPRKSAWIAGLGAVACAIYRFSFWDAYNHQWLAFQTQVRADALLLGCITAILFNSPTTRDRVARLSTLLSAPALLTLLYCIPHFHWLPPFFECIAICILICSTVSHPQWIAARLLSVRWLAWLGTVSYSVYIWQQLFLAHYAWPPLRFTMMCLMPVFALGSYYLLERQSCRVGHRLTEKARPLGIQAQGS